MQSLDRQSDVNHPAGILEAFGMPMSGTGLHGMVDQMVLIGMDSEWFSETDPGQTQTSCQEQQQDNKNRPFDGHGWRV